MLAMTIDNKNEQLRSELQAVRSLLRDWRRWKQRWFPHLGLPGAVPYLHQMKPTFDSYTEGEDYDERIDAHTMRQVDQAVERDLTANQRAAIGVYYLNEIGPAVWRSNRVPREEVRRLCDEAEAALIVALRRRDVRLT